MKRNGIQTPSSPEIQAYLSHSYRAEDRDINLFFWNLFSSEGFFFTVDPKSDKFVVPHLELMLRFSDCFIAIVTRRLGMINEVGGIVLKEPRSIWTHSPYIAFENYLAEMADKPRLIFIENGLDANLFGNSEQVHFFEPTTLIKKQSQFREIVHDFSEKVRTYMNYRGQVFKPSGKAGILINSDMGDVYQPDLISDIKSALSTSGYSAEVLSPNFESTQTFIRKLSGLDLVVADVNPLYTTETALAIVQAKALPCIRINKVEESQSSSMSNLPKIIRDYKVGDIEPVIYWKKKDELILDILLCVSKFQQTRTLLDSFEQGRRYFLSAGRKPSKVFISNSNSLNDVALALVKGFQTVNIGFFQYQSSLKIGTVWKDELERELQEFDIFIALINEDYHNSEYCRYELKTAFDRWKKKEVDILPYIVQPTHLPELIKDQIQCAFVHTLEHNEIVDQIVHKIDDYLIGKEQIIKGDVNTTLRKELFGGGNKWAILIGADNYDDRLNYSNLQVCVKDATSIQSQLLQSGFSNERVNLLTDKSQVLPSRHNILVNLKAMADATEPNDLLLFYYSGHGEGKNGESYLVSRTGRHLLIEETGVPISKIKDIMRSAPAQAKVLIIDACHSGANIGRKESTAMSPEFIQRVFEEAKGFAILSSCQQGQVSYEWRKQNISVFTYYLLEALQGKADYDKKGFVTIQDANRYVTNGVKLWASQNGLGQTPTLQSEVSGDIILVRV